MDTDTQKALAEQRQYLEAIYASVEKTRKYFLWTLIISVALFIFPLIGLLFAIPAFISSYAGALSL